MSPLEKLEKTVWQRMIEARMNKYYHQYAVQNYGWLNNIANLFALLTVVAAGVQVQLGQVIPFLIVAIAISAFLSLGTVILDISRKISLHQSLFEAYNEVEMELATEDGKFDYTDDPQVQFLTYDEIDRKFRKLEAKQPSPSFLLLNYCDGRVRQEIGKAKRLWFLPFFRPVS